MLIRVLKNKIKMIGLLFSRFVDTVFSYFSLKWILVFWSHQLFQFENIFLINLNSFSKYFQPYLTPRITTVFCDILTDYWYFRIYDLNFYHQWSENISIYIYLLQKKIIFNFIIFLIFEIRWRSFCFRMSHHENLSIFKILNMNSWEDRLIKIWVFFFLNESFNFASEDFEFLFFFILR